MNENEKAAVRKVVRFRVRELWKQTDHLTFLRFTIVDDGGPRRYERLTWLVKVEGDSFYVFDHGWQYLGHDLHAEIVAALLRVLS